MSESQSIPSVEKLNRLLHTAAASSSVHEMIIAVAADSELLKTAQTYVRQGSSAFGLSEPDLGLMCTKAGIRPKTFRSWMHTLYKSLSPDDDQETLYTVLGVDPSATPAEIKKAFRRKSLRSHPDHNPDDPGAADRFREVHQAYKILGNSSKRAEYDQSLVTWEDNWEEPPIEPQPPRWSQGKRQAVIFLGTVVSLFVLVTIIFDYQGWMEQRARVAFWSSQQAPAEEMDVPNPQGLSPFKGNENSSLLRVPIAKSSPELERSPGQPSPGPADHAQPEKTAPSQVLAVSASPQAQTFIPDNLPKSNEPKDRPDLKTVAKAFQTLFQESFVPPLQLEQALQGYQQVQVQETPPASGPAIVRHQRLEVRDQAAEIRDQKSEDGRQRTEGSGQRTEDSLRPGGAYAPEGGRETEDSGQQKQRVMIEAFAENERKATFGSKVKDGERRLAQEPGAQDHTKALASKSEERTNTPSLPTSGQNPQNSGPAKLASPQSKEAAADINQSKATSHSSVPEESAQESSEPSAAEKEDLGPTQIKKEQKRKQGKPSPASAQAKGTEREEAQSHAVKAAKSHPLPDENKKTAPGSRGSGNVKAEVNTFLDRYTRTYMDMDLDRFEQFFTDQATENGEPFDSMLPTYRKTFTKMKRITYDIIPQKFERTGSSIHVQGRFKIEAILNTNERVSSHGRIFLELIPKGSSFLVDSLQYRFVE
ncbi:MAG: DnaJ domain-containing protein [Desulfohalobiaceae bacterium]|nr:DnaJ domain-containing protein [Desulfohalobiaceae bacterium]